LLREVNTITNGELKDFEALVSEREVKHQLEKELINVSDAVQSNIMLSERERIELKQLEYDNAVIVGIDNPKYVSRGRFQYALTQGNTTDNLFIPSDISYYSMLSDRAIGVSSPIENEFLNKYGLAPYNEMALEYSLVPLVSYIQKHGLIGAKLEENNLIITNNNDTFKVLTISDTETQSEEFKSLQGFAEAVLSRPLVFDSVDFLNTTIALDTFDEINEALALVPKFNELDDEDVQRLVKVLIGYEGLTQYEALSTLTHVYTKDIDTAYRNSIIENTKPNLSLLVNTLLDSSVLFEKQTESPVKEEGKSFFVSQRVANVDSNIFGRISLIDKDRALITREWLYNARQSSDSLLNEIDLAFFNDMSVDNFSKLVPLTRLPIDSLERFTPNQEDGALAIKQANLEDLREIAHVLGISSDQSSIDFKNEIGLALNTRKLAFQVLNSEVLFEDVQPELSAYIPECHNMQDAQRWLLEETKQSAQRMSTYHYLELIKSCETHGYKGTKENLFSVSISELEQFEILELNTEAQSLPPGSLEYSYWSDTLGHTTEQPISLLFNEKGLPYAHQDKELIVDDEVHLYDEGTLLIALMDGEYYVATATGQEAEDDCIECCIGTDIVKINAQDVQELDIDKFGTVRDELGVNNNRPFSDTLLKGQNKLTNATPEDKRYISAVLSALRSEMEIFATESALTFGEFKLGMHDGLLGYYDEKGKLVASGKTVEAVQSSVKLLQNNEEENE
jgi:hypothetical protein